MNKVYKNFQILVNSVHNLLCICAFTRLEQLAIPVKGAIAKQISV